MAANSFTQLPLFHSAWWEIASDVRSRGIFWASAVGRQTFEHDILFKGDDDSDDDDDDANIIVGEAVQWHDATGFKTLACYYEAISRMAEDPLY